MAKELGVGAFRYGPPLYKTFMSPDRFDWEFADLAFAELNKLGLVPIADLCHFGVPSWVGDFQNPDFPDLFASYASHVNLKFAT